MEKKTLEQIIAYEKAHRCAGGPFGITACKECIKSELELDKKLGVKSSLFTYLEKCMARANDPLFNKAMILACWELINGKED